MYLQDENRFVKVNFLTILVLYIVILAGGIVRSTGSGMGCPDWPKCFNRFIPPTHVSQLPIGYEQTYIDKRNVKNQRFAEYLDFFGFKESARQIRNDKSILKHEEFNAVKTWTEYFNRLAGATAGIFLLLTAVFSFPYIRTRKRIVVLSILNLLLVYFQAWLGSIVVSTNLTPWVITVHMVLALVIVGVSIYTYFQAKILREKSILVNASSNWIKIFSIFLVAMTLVQTVIGTDVREQIDSIALELGNQARGEWVSHLDTYFLIHRELALVVFILNVLLFFIVRTRFAKESKQSMMVNIMIVLLLVQVASGLILAYLDMPNYMQTIHLLASCIIFGIQYYLTLLLSKASNYIGH